MRSTLGVSVSLLNILPALVVSDEMIVAGVKSKERLKEIYDKY